MARKDTAKTPKAQKEPGRIAQMKQVFTMTRRYDPAVVWWMVLGAVLSIGTAVGLALWLARGNVIGTILWIVTGVLLAVLVAMIILGRRAERAAYGQIAGQPGAVGAVFRGSLPRGWRGSEMPVHVNPKTQDALYRAVGRGGVVLVAEGPKSRTNRSVVEEKRKLARILPNVPVEVLYVGPDDDAVELHRLPKRIKSVKKQLTKPEMLAVVNRLSSLGGTQLPIPKGVDPNRVRPQRGR